MSDIEKKMVDETQPGEYAASDDIMHNDVTADRDTNGISAPMVRFGDLDNEKYDEKMDEVSADLSSEE